MKGTVLMTIVFVPAVCCSVFGQGRSPTVAAFADKVLQARPLDLSHVRLLGGPLKHAQDLEPVVQKGYLEEMVA